MTTASLAIPLTSGRATSLPKPRAAQDKFAIGALTLTFLGSILQYCVERNDLVRLVPVVVLIACAFVFLFLCPRGTRRQVLLSVTSPPTLGIIAAVSIPTLLSSLYRTSAFPFQYGVMMIATLIAIRILLSGIGFEGLFLAFFYGTTAGILIVVASTTKDLMASLGSVRYAPFFFDPNRIGYFVVTSIPAQLWFAVRRRQYHLFLVSAFCVFVIMAASSRGSLGALLIGAAITALLYAAHLFRYSFIALSRSQWIAVLALLCVAIGFAAAHQATVVDAGQYLSTKLAMDNKERGLDSGFTGRTKGWAELLDILPRTSWLLGNGYRTSDEDFSFSVDNGYLAALYETGVPATLIVSVKYAFVLFFMCALYMSDPAAPATCMLALFFTFLIFLANAFVHRVFFGFGDPASILALFLFVSTRRDVIDVIHPASSKSLLS